MENSSFKNEYLQVPHSKEDKKAKEHEQKFIKSELEKSDSLIKRMGSDLFKGGMK